ncbi:MAG: hypothetical protein ABI216_12415 [Devosia sp.]
MDAAATQVRSRCLVEHRYTCGRGLRHHPCQLEASVDAAGSGTILGVAADEVFAELRNDLVSADVSAARPSKNTWQGARTGLKKPARKY